MTDIYILDAVRTPFGRYGGALSRVRPDDLAAHALKALLDRMPALDPATIDDVILGNANGAGEENRDVARMAVLLAGLPTSVTGVAVNRLCGSSLEAAIQGSRAIAADDASLVVAGGVESMSRAPWVLPKPGKGFPVDHETLHSTTLGWRMVNPAMPGAWTISLGASAEKLADMYDISRDEQDAFALRSHQRAAAAWDEGIYDDEVVGVPGADLQRDEGIRADTSLEKLGRLKPAFVEGGTVTAGNAVAAQRRRRDAAARRRGERQQARGAIRSHGWSRAPRMASTPTSSASAPSRRPTRRCAAPGSAGATSTVVELNEAFASQSLACLRGWPDLDPGLVNVRGGAIAMGHPLGASGARILGRLAHELQSQGGGYGVAAICIGVGQGLAVVLHA